MNIEKQYLELLKKVLEEGHKKEDRTGTGTLSLFGAHLEHDMSLGFPLLTTKKVFLRGIFEELMWFLRGETNIKTLIEKGVNIWNGDAYKKYYEYASSFEQPVEDLHIYDPELDKVRCFNMEEFIEKIKTVDWFCEEYGECGPIYGAQWRGWRHSEHHLSFDEVYDQMKILINNLKHNPDSRRLIVSSWNVGYLKQMLLPPCHYGFQVWTRDLSFIEKWIIAEPIYDKQCDSVGAMAEDIKSESELDDFMIEEGLPLKSISLMWNQRSADLPLGIPFNIASYALLLEILAKEVNMVPGKLKCTIGDAHIYLNQIEGVKEQITREPKKLPRVNILNKKPFDKYEWKDIELNGYDPHPKISFPLSN